MCEKWVHELHLSSFAFDEFPFYFSIDLLYNSPPRLFSSSIDLLRNDFTSFQCKSKQIVPKWLPWVIDMFQRQITELPPNSKMRNEFY